MTRRLADLKIAYADALWCWAQIEAALFGIYSASLGLQSLRQYEAIRESFFAVISFEVRLAMTHAAAKVVWSKRHKHMHEWLAIYEKCQKAARQRGRIAHLSGGIWTADSTKADEAVVVAQPFGHPRFPDYSKAKSEGITTETLKGYVDAWSALLVRMGNFVEILVNERQPSVLREPGDSLMLHTPYQCGLTRRGRA